MTKKLEDVKAKEGTVYQTLSQIDCSEMTEKKGQISYLSWTHAWHAVKCIYPDATFEKMTFVDNQNNVLPFMRDTKRYTYVGVKVTIGGHTITEIYPVLNHLNKAVVDADSFQVNTALQRGLTKCLAYHGLGINIYAGEDLPMEDLSEAEDEKRKAFEELADKIKSCNTVEILKTTWSDNNDVINSLGGRDKANVISIFRNRKKSIEEKKKI
jgi:hypothetical protein